MTSVEGATAGNRVVTTAINDFDGEDESKKDKASIQLDPPVHVSEEGLTDAKGNVIGNKDNSSAQHKNNTTVTANNKGNAGYDVTNDTTTTGKIRLTNVDANDAKTIAGLQIDMNTDTKLTAKQLALTWKSTETPTQKVWAASNKDGDAIVVTFDKTGKNVGGNAEFDYTVKLLRPIDHPTKGVELNGEDNLPISFNIAVKEGNKSLTTQATTVVVVEDDAPIAVEAVHVVDVPKDKVLLNNVKTGFKNPEGNNVVISDTDGNQDGFEKLAWNVSSYTLENDGTTRISSTLDKPFVINNMTHENKHITGASFSGADFDVKFDIAVNDGQAKTISNAIKLKHLETFNFDYRQVSSLADIRKGGFINMTQDAEKYKAEGITADDFIVFKMEDRVELIDGKRYKLTIQGFDADKQLTTEGLKEGILQVQRL